MTDPKELLALASSPFIWTEHEHAKAVEALRTLARILTASPDVREIEERHADEDLDYQHAQHEGWGHDWKSDTGHSDRATLLDVVRRKDAEIERLRWAYQDMDKCRAIASHANDEARTALQEERALREEQSRLRREAEERAERLAEGVRRYAARDEAEHRADHVRERYHASYAIAQEAEAAHLAARVAVDEWQYDHGGLVGKEGAAP